MALGPVILDLSGTSLQREEVQLLLQPAVGGVIIFARNIENYAQLQALVASIREQRSELLICVDQEGGRVQRCRDGFTRLPAMQRFDHLYRHDAPRALSLAEDCGWLMAAEVLALGMDFSFAPVLDVDDDFCSVIGDRAFSSSPEQVSALAEAFVDGAREAGMAVTGKHFPGHGSVRGDSHLELPVDPRSLEEIQSSDLIPFKRLSSKLDGMMPAHILFPQVDECDPVGFSSRWLKQILRIDLDYHGVIFSDDLSMEGASQQGSYLERTSASLAAGCDMVLVCNNRAGALEVVNGLTTSQLSMGLGQRDSMRARTHMSREQLQQSVRWQRTVSALSQLNG